MSGLFLERQLEESGIPLNVLHSSDISNPFERLIMNLHEEIYFNNPPLSGILRNHVGTGIAQIARTNTATAAKAIPAGIAETKWVLDFQYREDLPLSMLARIAGCSVPYLCLRLQQNYIYYFFQDVQKKGRHESQVIQIPCLRN